MLSTQPQENYSWPLLHFVQLHWVMLLTFTVTQHPTVLGHATHIHTHTTPSHTTHSHITLGTYCLRLQSHSSWPFRRYSQSQLHVLNHSHTAPVITHIYSHTLNTELQWAILYSHMQTHYFESHYSQSHYSKWHWVTLLTVTLYIVTLLTVTLLIVTLLIVTLLTVKLLQMTLNHASHSHTTQSHHS